MSTAEEEWTREQAEWIHKFARGDYADFGQRFNEYLRRTKGMYQERRSATEQSTADREIEALKAQVRNLRTQLASAEARMRAAETRGIHYRTTQTEIPAHLWRKLIAFAHPDKHNNSAESNEVTLWLLENKPR